MPCHTLKPWKIKFKPDQHNSQTLASGADPGFFSGGGAPLTD